MTPRLPVWIIVVLVIQLLLALLIFALGWSMTSSLTYGRTLPLADLMLLASPMLAVVLCGALAQLAWRRQQRPLATLLALIPLPAAFLLFGFLGAI